MKIDDINFATRPKVLAIDIMSYNSTSIAFAPYGNYWRQLRKICTLELLSLKRPIREEDLSNLVKWIDSHKGSSINLTQEVLSSIYTIASRAAFGKKCKDQENFISVVKKTIKVAEVLILTLEICFLMLLGFNISLNKEGKSKDKGNQSEAEKDLVDVLTQYEDEVRHQQQP
ncbi:Cytochrome P450 71D11 [Glycine max]|nr:Cytochrome P450 71D11 [Glycine max]